MNWMQSMGDAVHRVPHGGLTSQEPVLLSIVIPAMNEEITVGEFVDWCREGLRAAGVPGQILIVDSSTDRTPEIALEHGAEVLSVPQRGLGRAYIDAIPYIRGKWVVMGDADLTYDFRLLKPFVEAFQRGEEFVMGSRFRGSIEPGAMPPLHQYFGTPGTTWILNCVYGSRFSDIHCGMRGVTRAALVRMRLQSQSWQYASEMIIRALHLRLRCGEVPVRFLKDREGRMSHLKRIGWWAPWHAAWISLEAMFVSGADFFLMAPGALLAGLGTFGVILLLNGPVTLGGIGFSIHWMFLFVICALAGWQCLYMGWLAKAIYDPERNRVRGWLRFFGYNRGVLASLVLMLLGIAAAGGLALEYVRDGFRLPPVMGSVSFRAVAGLGLLFLGFMHFGFMLVFNALLQRGEPTVTDPISS
jgi:hypothetical protein